MNYYEILGLENTAGKRDIKIAYAKMVRKYSPEENPEEYNKIREAYEILSNEYKRAEYDAYAMYSNEIESYLDSATLYMDNNEYKEAIKCYKKILLLEPSLHYIKNQLALAYGYNNNFEECVSLLNELILEYPDNYLYYYNLGHALSKCDRKDEAVKYWYKSLEIDPTHIETATHLVNLMIDLNKHDEAEALLRNRASGIENIHYYLELLKFYIKIENIEKINNIIEEMMNLPPKDEPEELDGIAFEIGKVAYDIKGPFKLKMSVTILEKLVETYPEDEKAMDLLNNRKARIPLCEKYINFCTKDIYEDCLVKYIYMNVNCDDFTDEEYKEIIEDILKEMKNNAYNYPDKLIDMLVNLKTDFTELYNLQNEYFDSLYKYCESWSTRYSEQKQLELDKKVPNCFKELISLWMKDNISDDERDNIFQEIRSNIYRLRKRVLTKGTNRLKQNYPALYELNPKYLDSLSAAGINEAGKYRLLLTVIIIITIIFKIISNIL